MIYFVNPAGKRTRRKRRSVATGRARTKATKRKKRATRTGGSMATRKKRRAAAPKRRRRASSRKRGSGVRLVRRGVTVYQGNPRRRRRRGGYRRNPAVLAQVQQTAMDAAMTLVGGAAGRTISNLIPIGGSPIVDFAKGTVGAIAVRMLANRFLGAERARFAAAGAMQVPLKSLIVGFVPAAAPFLGDYDIDALAAYSDVAGYIDGTGSTDAGLVTEADLASYSESY